MFALGVVVAPVLGPTLGGWLTDSYSWRWAFYINIPVGIFAIFMISRYVKDPEYIQEAKPGKFDGIGLGLLAVWLGALQIILDKGQEDDWFGATWIRWAFVVLIVCFVLFLFREFRHKQAAGGPARFPAPEFHAGMCADRPVWRGNLRIGDAAATLLSGTDGIHSTSSGVGGESARRWSDYRHANDRILTAKIDNRWLIVTGFAMFGISAIWFGEVNLVDRTMDVLVGNHDQRVRVRLRVCAAVDDHHGIFEERRDRKCQRTLQSAAQYRRQHRNLGREYDRGAASANASQ